MNPEELLEFIYISKSRMQIERCYALLERLKELFLADLISWDDYKTHSQEVEDILEEFTLDNPFNQIKKELNLFTI
jgi:hypothetical protein